MSVDFFFVVFSSGLLEPGELIVQSDGESANVATILAGSENWGEISLVVAFEHSSSHYAEKCIYADAAYLCHFAGLVPLQMVRPAENASDSLLPCPVRS